MSRPVDAPSEILDPVVKAYLAELGSLPADDQPLHDALAAYAAERRFPWIGPQSGRWLELLTRMIGGRRVFELGSGFGYSAFWFARAVGPQGQVLGSEKDAWELDAFDRLWGDHPLRARVSIANQGAFDALAAADGLFDVIFVDIEKRDYPAAHAAAVPRLRVGGLLLTDNVLWGGKVARPADPEDSSGTDAVRAYNRAVATDPRLLSLVLPTGDGLGVSLKLSD